jgi:hypothetical protein
MVGLCPGRLDLMSLASHMQRKALADGDTTVLCGSWRPCPKQPLTRSNRLTVDRALGRTHDVRYTSHLHGCMQHVYGICCAGM